MPHQYPCCRDAIALLLLQAQGPCPYFMSRELAAGADIVFMPYQYLIDPKTRTGMSKMCWENSVLIFDEAHNLEVRHEPTSTQDMCSCMPRTACHQQHLP